MKHKITNKFQLLISSAALLLILLVVAGVTYSWIEGGTTYSIKTDNSGDVKTGTAPVTNIVNSLTIDPGSNNEIDLNQFDKTTNNNQGLYFSEALSSDGENFYFPVAFDNDGKATSYREANTNDVGTKFIKYNFNLKAAKSCFLTFSETPTITATAKDGSVISDTSAFRIMLKCGDTRHIFTTSEVAETSTVVTNVSGTTITTEEVTAKPISDYVYGKSEILFELDKDSNNKVYVSVWLDAQTSDSNLIGANVTIDFKLKASSSELYLKPNDNWVNQGNPRFAMYLFNDSTQAYTWVSMTDVGLGYYKAMIPDGDYDKVIFCRMNGSNQDNNWDNRWTQTDDLSIPTDDKLCYKIDDSCGIVVENKATGTWIDIP